MDPQITAYPMGGAVADFQLDKGNFRVQVVDASYAETKTGQYQQLLLHLIVAGDPNHPEREGKGIKGDKPTPYYQTCPSEQDPIEKQRVMRAFFKRMIYDGFGLKWPDEEHRKPLDPRVLVGKFAWVQVGDKVDKRTERKTTGITSIVQTPDKLPPARASAGGNGTTGGGNGAAGGEAGGGRRRRAA